MLKVLARAHGNPGSEEECEKGRKEFDAMRTFGGIDKLNDRTDPSGILRRLRASQQQRLKKEHAWLYGAMDPTHGYADPHSES